MRSPDGSIPAVTPRCLFMCFLPAFVLPVFLCLGAATVHAAPAGKKSAKSEAPPVVQSEKKSSATTTPTLVPLPVIEDLIAAGHLEDAQTALHEWDNSGKSAEEVKAVKKHLANAQTAATLFKDAEGKASQAAALRGIEREKRDEIKKGYIAQGIKYLAQNKFDDSETYFQLALQIDPNCFDAKAGLNNVAEARKKAPAAEGSSSTSSVAAALLPEDQTGQPSREDATLARAADLFRQGFQAEQGGDYDEASKLYQDVLKLFPNSEDAQRRLMAIETKRSVQLASAKPKKASQPVPVPDQADIALQIAPIYDEGVRAFNSKDFSRAQDRFAAVLQIAPDHLPSQQYLDQCAALQTAAPAGSLDLNSSGTSQVAMSHPDFSDPWGSRTESPRVEKKLEGVLIQEKKAVAPVASAPTAGQSPAWLPEKTSEPLREIPSETVLHQSRRAPVVVAQSDPAAASPDPQPAPVAPMSQQPTTSPPPPPAPGPDYTPPRTGGEQVNEMIEVGVRASQKGDILTAYEMWEKALSLDPTNPTARAFLEKYADEHAEASRRKGEDSKKREIDDRVDSVLDEKTFVLEQDTSVNINSILSTMGAIADLQIITGEGVDGDIHALRTTELTYRAFLDRVLTLNGYTWKREPGTNIIEVTRDIIQKRFPLSESQYQALKRLAMDHLGGKETDDYSEALREVILGKVEPRDIDTTVPGRKFFLSKFLLELVVRDSRHNVELVQQFLDLYNQNALTIENPPLLVETFRLPKTGGDNLARIINLRLFGNAEFKTDFKDDEPYLVYDDTSGILIIRQTPEKLQLVKRLMSDPKFLKDVTERDLKARKFTVVPSEDLRSDTPDSQLRRRKQVQFTRQVFQSLLYGSQSIEEAAAEGRVMYPDPDEGTIDVVDTPDNLKKIEEYLNGITETSNLTRVIQVRRRDVLDLALSLSGLVLNVRTTGGLGGQGLGGAAQGGRFGGGGGVGGGGLGGGGGQFGGGGGQFGGGGGQFGGGLGGGIGQGLGGGGFGGGGLGGGGFGGGGFGGGGLGGGLGGGGFGFFGIIPVMVTGDVVTKQLVVTGFRLSDLDRVEDLVERLDVPVEQVEVEVRLVELTYDSSDALGVTMTINNLLEIDDNDEPGPGFTLSDAAADFVSQPGNPAGSSLTLATIGRTTIDATLNFLSQFSDIRILTAPKLTVVSGRQGNVFLGEQIPYIESYDNFTTPGSDTTTVVANSAVADFGFTLDTLPTVTGDGHIEMELNPVLTVPGDRLPLPNPVTGDLDPVGLPSSEERSASVRVRVNDGETLVIGGLLRRQLNHSEGRTPLFGYIPGLAPLFTERSDIETTQNLLILVTARIIKED